MLLVSMLLAGANGSGGGFSGFLEKQLVSGPPRASPSLHCIDVTLVYHLVPPGPLAL